MQLIDLSLSTTAANLALDEWLLETSDNSRQARNVFRIWENPVPAVVLGRSSKYETEVNHVACCDAGIEVLRRVSGGTSVVIGPGCLMYGMVLDYRTAPELRLLDKTHRYVLTWIQKALQGCGIESEFQGTCDLTIGNRKFSGNSLRCKRNCLLYHGTLLYDFQLELMEQLLGKPPRQPDYRGERTHADFVTNLPVSADRLRRSLAAACQLELDQPDTDPIQIDRDAVAHLVREKYARHDWTWKH